MTPTEPSGWLYFLFAGTIPLAAISWTSLFVTIAGFAVAIYQLMRIKTASEASVAASQQVLDLVRERMNLTELVAAAGYVDSIRSYIGSGNNEGAIIYIELLRSKFIYLREIALRDANDAEEVGRFLVDLALISKQLQRPSKGREEIIKILASFIPMSDMLQRLIARLRFRTPSTSEVE